MSTIFTVDPIFTIGNAYLRGSRKTKSRDALFMKIGASSSILRIQGSLAQNTSTLATVFERLASGQRINSASDDPAGLAVASSLNLDRAALAQGVRNLNDGVSLLNIADGALDALSNIVTRLEELAQQAASGVLNTRQRSTIDREAQGLSAEYLRIARTTEFNQTQLFDGTFGELQLQAGAGTGATISSGLGGAIGTGTFGGAVSYATEGFMSYAAALADLNGDGVSDLCTAGTTDSSDGYATIMLGQGGGTFADPRSYATEDRVSYALSLGDLNSDGIMDMVTAGRTDGDDGYITIRIGAGDGTFGGAISYQAESGPSLDIALGDLNGDGALDVATAGTTDGNDGYATIRLGNGDGTLSAAVSYSAESKVSRTVALGDLNNDGSLDLVTGGWSDANDGYATVRLGRGDGTFSTAVSYATESYATIASALGDVNGDGNLDLATAGFADSMDGYATIRFGMGDGSFAGAASYAAEGNTSKAVTLGDINGDGIKDLITAGYSDAMNGYVTVRLGSTDGTFAAARSYATDSATSENVVLGDINRDGVPDLIAAGKGTDSNGYAAIRLADVRDGVAPLLPFDLSTLAGARQAIPVFQAKREQLSAQRGHVGAFQARLGFAIHSNIAASTALASASARITDIDVAEETAKLAAGQIRQQAAVAILAQANQEQSLVLGLIYAML